MNKYIYSILIMSILTLLIGSAVGQDANAGQTVFNSKCNTCHKLVGTGIGPNMTVLSSDSASDIRDIVRNGSSATPVSMPPFNVSGLSDSDLDNVIAYIMSQNTTQNTTGTETSTPMPYNTPYGTTTTTPISNLTGNETGVSNTAVSTTTPYVEATTPPTIETTTVATPPIIETPVATTPVPTPKSPGFDIILGAIGILFIYRLKFR